MAQGCGVGGVLSTDFAPFQQQRHKPSCEGMNPNVQPTFKSGCVSSRAKIKRLPRFVTLDDFCAILGTQRSQLTVY